MVSDKNVVSAVGGKTARACDNCVRKRARWYCAADDAFLCQACDFSVHSANPLARRHERVRLKTASFKSLTDESPVENSIPSWHRGFKRKPRTPRGKSSAAVIQNRFPVVPEVGDEISNDENDEQILYRVPIFDPFVGEICTSVTDVNRLESKVLLAGFGQDDDNLHGFLSPEMDLDFAANVESLLGRGLENESYGMEGLGLIDCKEDDSTDDTFFSGRVKVEEKEGSEMVPCHFDTEVDMERETFELNFDYDTPASCGEEDEKVSVAATRNNAGENEIDGGKKRPKLLKLDYESVISSWSSQGCPWTTGSRPDINADDYWPDCMGIYGEVNYAYGEIGGMGGNLATGDGGREARVSRYREKRRTRLFSKKIRYEVRKLNAEKRPRMKGRFVKRTSVGAPGFALIN